MNGVHPSRRGGWSPVLVLAAALATHLIEPRTAPCGAERSAAEWRTLWRGVLGQDTLVVSASWLPYEAASRESTYVGYRIEDSHGGLWASDTIPDMRGFSGGWCDGLSAEATPWKAGHVITMTSLCWPCYTDSCAESQFVYLAGKDSVAKSDWTHIEWDPAAGDSANRWVQSDCVAFAIPLRARVRGARLDFDPDLPTGVNQKLFRVPAQLGNCGLGEDPSPGPATIGVYSTLEATIADSLVVEDVKAVEVLSVFIRAPSAHNGDFAAEVSRVEIGISGRRVVADRGVLLMLGFWEP